MCLSEFRGAKFKFQRTPNGCGGVVTGWFPADMHSREIAKDALEDLAVSLAFSHGDAYLLALPQEREAIFERWDK